MRLTPALPSAAIWALLLVVMDGCAAEEKFPCVSSAPPGSEPCETGLCFDSLNVHSEQIDSGCALSASVCSFPGCSLSPADGQTFVCCCAHPFCNGKSPHLVKARWRMFRKGDYPARMRKSAGQEANGTRTGPTERVWTSTAKTVGEEGTTTTTAKATTAAHKKTEKTPIKAKTTQTSTPKVATTSKSSREVKETTTKRPSRNETAKAETTLGKGGGVTILARLTKGTTAKPTSTSASATTQKRAHEDGAKKELEEAVETTAVQAKKGASNNQSGTVEEEKGATNTVSTTRGTSTQMSTRGTSTQKATVQTTTATLTTTTTATSASPTPTSTATATTAKATTTTTTSATIVRTQATTTGGGVQPAEGKEGKRTKQLPLDATPTRMSSSSAPPPQPLPPQTSFANASSFAPKLEQTPSGPSRTDRTTRAVPTVRPAPAEMMPSFPWYWVTLAGFASSSAVFFLVYWCVRSCQRIFAKQRGRQNGRSGSRASGGGEEPMIPMANGKTAKKGNNKRRVKREMSGQMGMMVGGGPKRGPATNESLVSQCTNTTNATEDDGPMGVGETVTVIDPLLNQQWSGTMNK